MGHKLDYRQWNDGLLLLRRHTITKTEGTQKTHWGQDLKVRGCVKKRPFDVSWVPMMQWPLSPRGLLTDEKRKAALANLYQLVSREVFSGLVFLRNEGWKQKGWREPWGPSSDTEPLGISEDVFHRPCSTYCSTSIWLGIMTWCSMRGVCF